jgi:hypothetical protein
LFAALTKAALQIGAAVPCKSLEHLKAYSFPADKALGAGVIDGRNVWADNGTATATLAEIQKHTKATVRVQVRLLACKFTHRVNWSRYNNGFFVMKAHVGIESQSKQSACQSKDAIAHVRTLGPCRALCLCWLRAPPGSALVPG